MWGKQTQTNPILSASGGFKRGTSRNLNISPQQMKYAG